MVRIETHRAQVQAALTDYAAQQPPEPGVEVQTIFDTEHDHYQIVYAGWQDKRRVYGCVLHLDLKEGKIWIQHDGTESGIAEELVARGIPKEEIVLAFHAPYKRPYTGFAVS